MNSLQTRDTVLLGDRRWELHRLDRLGVDHLPFTLKVLLVNLLRHEDGQLVTAGQVEAVRRWDPTAGRRDEVDPHVELEYARNSERYWFLKWSQTALDKFKIVPPGMGIMHQVDIEYLARVVETDGDWVYPDVCLGTDSRTTMVNGLGVLGWGIGRIEAEAVMLGQSLSLVVPPVVGFRLTGELPPGATATDLVLTITELLRGHGVVGKFVEFHGPGVARTSVADRVTIANMSPEFGSTCAVFPIDAQTVRYLRFTGRRPEHVALVEAYAKQQGLWHEADMQLTYSEQVELDLCSVVASLAGPRRPRTGCPSPPPGPPSAPSWAAPPSEPTGRPPGWTRRPRSPSRPATPPPSSPTSGLTLRQRATTALRRSLPWSPDRRSRWCWRGGGIGSAMGRWPSPPSPRAPTPPIHR